MPHISCYTMLNFGNCFPTATTGENFQWPKIPGLVALRTYYNLNDATKSISSWLVP